VRDVAARLVELALEVRSRLEHAEATGQDLPREEIVPPDECPASLLLDLAPPRPYGADFLAEPLLAGHGVHRLAPQLDDGSLHVADERMEGDLGHSHLILPLVKEVGTPPPPHEEGKRSARW